MTGERVRADRSGETAAATGAGEEPATQIPARPSTAHTPTVLPATPGDHFEIGAGHAGGGYEDSNVGGGGGANHDSSGGVGHNLYAGGGGGASDVRSDAATFATPHCAQDSPPSCPPSARLVVAGG